MEKDWPLTLMDNEGQKKMIYLKPGEMLLYESAKVPHGRQFPLEGEYYQNRFFQDLFKSSLYFLCKSCSLFQTFV